MSLEGYFSHHGPIDSARFSVSEVTDVLSYSHSSETFGFQGRFTLVLSLSSSL